MLLNMRGTTDCFLRGSKLIGKAPSHSFIIVDVSPWPVFLSFSLFTSAVSFAYFMHYNELHNQLKYGLVGVFLISFLWFSDLTKESTILGKFTHIVRKNSTMGFIIFIFTEVMFFAAFFWAFFATALYPTSSSATDFPPVGIEPIYPWGIPFYNTWLLLLSGVAVTWAHNAIIEKRHTQVLTGLASAIGLAILFTGLQVFEYRHAPFNISDSVFASCFYMTTGLHGLHVLVGTIFLTICLIKHALYHYTVNRHLTLEFAIWYWHFVDVVWLYLFAFMYVWGSSVV